MFKANVQLRVRESVLHVQGNGPSINRPYGVSFDLRATAAIRSTVDSAVAQYPSLNASSKAGTGKTYIKGQMFTRDGATFIDFDGHRLKVKPGRLPSNAAAFLAKAEQEQASDVELVY